MFKQFLFSQIFILIAFIVNHSICEKSHPKPLIFKSWPPNTNQRMMMQLRGAASSKILQRLPGPNAMMVKAPGQIRFGIPMRPNMKLHASPSNQFYYKVTPHPMSYKQRPVQVPSYFNKFSSTPQKPAIKFASQPIKSKPEFVYEKVTVPKFPEPLRFTINSAIHTIPAPNLSSEKGNEISHNSLSSQLDKDLTKFVAQGFALQHQQPSINHHQYQVKEIASNDATIKNHYTGQKTYFAPDHDPSLRTPNLRPTSDPLSIPSDGKQKPLDVLLYQQNLNYGAGSAPLVHIPHFAVDSYTFPVTSQPQLQQYQALQQHQNSMVKHLDPTFLVSQSNNLYSQHQQMLGSKLQYSPPSNGLIVPVTAQPSLVTINEVASIGQIYSAQNKANQDASIVSTTFAPTTIAAGYHAESSHEEPVVLPTINQVEPKPQNYLYSQNNFIDLPEEHLSQNDIQNFLNYEQQLYNDYMNHRQQENDIILREAQEKLQYKLLAQQQQKQTAYDLHKLVQQEQYSPLRIVVPDEADGVSLNFNILIDSRRKFIHIIFYFQLFFYSK
jgi:hypothetical protein